MHVLRTCGLLRGILPITSFRRATSARALQNSCRAGRGWCPGLPPVELVEEGGEQEKTTTVHSTSPPYVVLRV